jgi:hypothetical protein
VPGNGVKIGPANGGQLNLNQDIACAYLRQGPPFRSQRFTGAIEYLHKCLLA